MELEQIKPGDKVRVNEGVLEGQVGSVTGVDVNDNVVYVSLDRETFIAKDVAFYPAILVSADEEHPALEKMRSLYPDFLTSDNYRFRLTTFVGGVMYESPIPMDADLLQSVLKTPPAGLQALEFMLKKDDSSRGLAWKLLWSE